MLWMTASINIKGHWCWIVLYIYYMLRSIQMHTWIYARIYNKRTLIDDHVTTESGLGMSVEIQIGSIMAGLYPARTYRVKAGIVGPPKC